MSLNFKLILLVLLQFAVHPAHAQNIPDFSYRQSYLGAPPKGMNIIYARKYLGGYGDGIKIVDIEGSWNLDHIDLSGNVGSNIASVSSAAHGTSVMGILVAKNNGYGITGFAPDAFAYGIKNTGNDHDDIVSELDKAINYLDQNGHKGDIILVEVQVQNGDYHELPAELDDTQGNANAIKGTVDKGYIVVEVAGNGNSSIDPLYVNGLPNTGAIIVGAKDSMNVYRAGKSNYGGRIDANGWGEFITTTGSGDLWGSESEPNIQYTANFSGTSGATPMVTGAIAVLQAINEHYKGVRLSPQEMCSLIRGNNDGSMSLGIRPNLKTLVHKLEIPTTITVKQIRPD